MIITLTASDMMLGAMAGIMRNVENISKKRVPAHGAGSANDFGLNILGCLGELVVSRCLGVTWHGKGVFRGPDVGQDIQVRTAERNGPVSLIVHPDDPDDALFYLVRRFEGEARFEVFGPMKGSDAKQKRWWKEDVRNPAYFVPSSTVDNHRSFA